MIIVILEKKFWNFLEIFKIRIKTDSEFLSILFQTCQRVLVHNNFDRGILISSRWIFKGLWIHCKSRRNRVSLVRYHVMFNNFTNRDRVHDKEFWCCCFHNFDDWKNNSTSSIELFRVRCSFWSLGLGWNRNSILWTYSQTCSQMLSILQKLEEQKCLTFEKCQIFEIF